MNTEHESQMVDKPLLVFPRPSVTSRANAGGRSGHVHFPTHARQAQRLQPQFRVLDEVFESKRIELQGDPSGALPEQVLVMETIGPVADFLKAIDKTPDIEWLGEWDEEDIAPDDDFFKDEDHRGKLLDGRVYLVMTNQQAMTQLQSLWQKYRLAPETAWPLGQTKWRDLFQQLREIRPWSVEDRLRDTGVLDYWQERLDEGYERVRIEIELWFRNTETDRRRSRERLEFLLRQDGGQLISETIIPSIFYHGILAELPIGLVESIRSRPDTILVRSDQVMFFRPVAQVAVDPPADDEMIELVRTDTPSLPHGEPIVALLDGMPLQNHALLKDRLIIDDPDSFSIGYAAQDRQHGTAMASLIVHGDLESHQQPLTKPIYVRPILKTDPNDYRSPREEAVPDTVLPIDLIQRAVRRLFEPQGASPPIAPSIIVINLSVGDRVRTFDQSLSAWARLLDQLAWEYKLLFVVSAGNYLEEVDIDMPKLEFAALTPLEQQKYFIRQIAKNARYRQLLSPAESINALTVGSLHVDNSVAGNMGGFRDFFSSSHLPSPISRLGPGYRRAVKPEVLMPGGRTYFRDKIGYNGASVKLSVDRFSRPPGQRVAAPGNGSRTGTATRFTRGTSNATALVTRLAAELYDTLEDLSISFEERRFGREHIAVLLKAMIVHGARWGSAFEVLSTTLRTRDNTNVFKEHASRFLGYGAVEEERLFHCTDERVTVISADSIAEGQAHVYTFPLPTSLSGEPIHRRLTITLAWLTPTNPKSRAYRTAALWFTPPMTSLGVARTNVADKATKRGTVQHEILEGDRVTAYGDDEKITIQVNCRKDADEFHGLIPYALIVSLEVAEGVGVHIYEEIRQRIRGRVSIAAR